LHALDPADERTLQVACMRHPEHGSVALLLVPVRALGATFRYMGPGISLPDSPALAESDEWVMAPLPDHGDGGEHTPADINGHLAILVYPPHQTLVKPGDTWPWACIAPDTSQVSIGADALNDWMARQSPKALGLAFVSDSDVRRTRAAMRAQPDNRMAPASLAVCSCQYPAGLIDALPASVSLNALSVEVDAGHIATVLMLGDQIYSDATAGLADPTRHDELFLQPHQRAYRFAPMRDVLRKVIVHTLPDDHEITDNWEPVAPALQTLRPGVHKRNMEKREAGMAAWWKYQAVHNHPPRGLDQPVDRCFSMGGLPIYMADTRNARSARGSLVPSAEQCILGDGQFTRLCHWMQNHADTLHVVATPALLLPRRTTTAASQHGYQYADNWDGFPASLYRLFDWMMTHQIQRTVFVSGDEHHSLFARITLRREGCTPVRTLSVHSSALYAPLPFANGHPADLVDTECFDLRDLQVEVHTTFAPPGDGFTVLTPVIPDTGRAEALDIAFHTPATRSQPTVHRVKVG
jgi:hypothetical protein